MAPASLAHRTATFSSACSVLGLAGAALGTGLPQRAAIGIGQELGSSLERMAITEESMAAAKEAGAPLVFLRGSPGYGLPSVPF